MRIRSIVQAVDAMNTEGNSTPQGPSRSGPQPTVPVVGTEIAERRRRMLRLVAGGVPLMSALPAAAGSLAASSAWRAARQDATQSPPKVTLRPDGWIRQQVSIVTCEPVPATSTSATTSTATASTATLASPLGASFRAYKVGTQPSTRYYRIPDLAQVDLQALGMREARVDGYAYGLVLFDGNARVVGIDPARTAGSGGIQGLHCSSWRSIAGVNFPGCGAGFGV
jgi:hypothetical protein